MTRPIIVEDEDQLVVALQDDEIELDLKEAFGV